jgi:hypothetical protein
MLDLEPIPAHITDINTTCDNCINAPETDNVEFDPTDSINLESTTPLTRHEKILSVFHKYRSDPNFHYIFTMGRPPISTPTDDDPRNNLPYIQEETESDDDWDNPTDPTPATPSIPPAPPVSSSDVPGPSIPANPPAVPPGNPTISNIKQKLLTLFQKF